VVEAAAKVMKPARADLGPLADPPGVRAAEGRRRAEAEVARLLRRDGRAEPCADLPEGRRAVDRRGGRGLMGDGRHSGGAQRPSADLLDVAGYPQHAVRRVPGEIGTDQRGHHAVGVRRGRPQCLEDRRAQCL